MDAKDVTADIGDRSNIASAARLSAVEQAATDARRHDLGTLSFHDNGMPTQQSLVHFIHSMPTSEQSELAPNGVPTTKAIDRLMAATFKQAYGSDELVDLYAQAQDPDAKTILAGLADAAGSVAALNDSGEYDIRGAMAEAAGFAVNAARRGLKLTDMLRTVDMTMSDEAFVIAQFMADNIRSAKRIAAGLRNAADLAASQAQITRENASQGGMFGETPTIGRSGIFRAFNDKSDTQEDGIRQPAGSAIAQGGAVQPSRERENGEEVARVAQGTGEVASAEDGLTHTTPEQVRADEKRAAQAEKEKKARDKAAEKSDKDGREAREIAARQTASAEHFVLGQSPEVSLSGQGGMFDHPLPPQTEPAKPGETSESAQDDGADIPPAYFARVKVAHEVWIEDENRSESVQVTAKAALASIRSDLDNYTKLLACMKG